MANCVGEKRDGEFVKGSSKPCFEETLEDKLRKLITQKNLFKFNGKILNVVKISEIQIESVKPGDFMYGQERFSHEFDGYARIHLDEQNGVSSNIMRIRGYAVVDDNGTPSISNIINIAKLYGQQ